MILHLGRYGGYKRNNKGIYYGTKYLFFGPEEKIIEVKETDVVNKWSNSYVLKLKK